MTRHPWPECMQQMKWLDGKQQTSSRHFTLQPQYIERAMQALRLEVCSHFIRIFFRAALFLFGCHLCCWLACGLRRFILCSHAYGSETASIPSAFRSFS